MPQRASVQHYGVRFDLTGLYGWSADEARVSMEKGDLCHWRRCGAVRDASHRMSDAVANHSPAPVDPSSHKPLLIYDGHCGFCRWSVRRLQFLTGDHLDYEPSQTAAERFPHIAAGEFAKSVFLVEPGGATTRAAHAVCRALALGRARRWPLWVYEHIPGAGRAMELGYRVIAASRPAITPIILLLYGRGSAPSTHYLTRRVLERGLGVIYLIACLSLWVQIHGLIGSRGILPIADVHRMVEQRAGDEKYRVFPTLTWLAHDDNALHWFCGAGCALAVLAILRLAPKFVFLSLWMLYFSLTTAGQTFLAFQWDMLLLETGLLTMLLAPWRLWPNSAREAPPSRVVLWLFRLLLFRLMFLSGVTKLAWKDPCWSDLTALTYHYWTQCIPNPIAWYVHQWPLWFHQFCCAAMFVIEIGVPFLMFLPGRPRRLCFHLQVLLQLTIIATGNYGYFNLLTILLCFSLLDDASLAKIFRWPFWKREVAQATFRRPPWLRSVLTVPLGVYFTAIGVLLIYDTSTRHEKLTQDQRRIILWMSSNTKSLNSYGLFRVMTRERREIVLEGSHDGREWLEYEFKYKPGDPGRRPPFVAPHQPRLDWQMWFAALGPHNSPRNAWFHRFLARVHEGSPPVFALLEKNPFPDRPPKFLRAVIYDYHFTDAKTRAETGHWWRRDNKKLYAPMLERREGP